MTDTELYSELISAFHLMWDGFPFSAWLLKRDRTVMAANPAAVARGSQVGGRCYQVSGEKSVHKQCCANEALQKGVAQRACIYASAQNAVLDSYWLPLPGVKDVFVHTVINISHLAKPELFHE